MQLVENALRQIDWSRKKILVSCSGGIDSMVLVHSMVIFGLKPEVIHINYQLRGNDSEKDQQLVEKTCSDLGLKLHIHRCPVELTKAEGVNLQSAARDFRRGFYKEWIAKSSDHIVALAHHADDQLETFFLQYFRGSGIFGLGGMHPENAEIVRPFLDLPKEELRNYAVHYGIIWREDKSNSEQNYLRNVLRNKLIPELLKQQPQLKEHALVLMKAFREEQIDLIESISNLVSHWNEQAGIAIKDWLDLSENRQFAFLRETRLGSGIHEQLTDLCTGAEGRKLAVNDQMLIRGKEFIQRIRKASEIRWDFKTELLEILPEIFSNDVLYLDADKVKVEELHFRPWKTGDRIASVGLKGSQLISDILKDAGVAFSQRALIFVLVDGNEIRWIPGFKVSGNGLAYSGTSRILKITAHSSAAL